METNLRTYSPLALAYIGDAVFELFVRIRVTQTGMRPVNEFHKSATGLVNAGAQARMAEALLPILSKEEEAIYRRGRNTRSATIPKHASVSDYRKATGFEALLGYLYLNGENDRLTELMQSAVEAYDRKKICEPTPE